MTQPWLHLIGELGRRTDTGVERQTIVQKKSHSVKSKRYHLHPLTRPMSARTQNAAGLPPATCDKGLA